MRHFQEVTLEAISAIEEAGLGEALNIVGDLLACPDGVKKHGAAGWLSLSELAITAKSLGHLSGYLAGLIIDEDSRRPTLAHFAARSLMLLGHAARKSRGVKS